MFKNIYDLISRLNERINASNNLAVKNVQNNSEKKQINQ